MTSAPLARDGLRLLRGLVIALALLAAGSAADTRTFASLVPGDSERAGAAVGGESSPTCEGRARLYDLVVAVTAGPDLFLEDPPPDSEEDAPPTLRERDGASAHPRRSPRPREARFDASLASGRAASPRGPPS